jgi:hypothetical protein
MDNLFHSIQGGMKIVSLKHADTEAAVSLPLNSATQPASSTDSMSSCKDSSPSTLCFDMWPQSAGEEKAFTLFPNLSAELQLNI